MKPFLLALLAIIRLDQLFPAKNAMAFCFYGNFSIQKNSAKLETYSSLWLKLVLQKFVTN